MQGPETRYSLLMRLSDLRDPGHHQAWIEFVEIYHPIVYQVAKRRGLQHADAQDMTQEVFAAVGRSIGSFDLDAEKGSFRGWLYRVTRNLVINFHCRGDRVRGSGDSQLNLLLDETVANEALTSSFDLEYRRELFRWAAKHVQQTVKPETWQAFWLTGVEGQTIDQVAKQLGKSNGAIRIARCRVIGRLKEQVKKYTLDDSIIGEE